MTTTYKSFNSSFVVYGIRTEWCDTLFYIGVCKLRELAELPDARRNSEWQKHMTPDSDIKLTIYATCDSLDQGKALQSYMQQVDPAWCNGNGTEGDPVATRVRCVSSGQEWDNATQAAKAMGVSRQHMSAHLKGDNRTVKGLIFILT